jgi:hypothetical protein
MPEPELVAVAVVALGPFLVVPE